MPISEYETIILQNIKPKRPSGRKEVAHDP